MVTGQFLSIYNKVMALDSPYLEKEIIELTIGVGSGRVKICPVKLAKFYSRKIIDVLSFLICLNFDLSETF